MPFFSVDPRIQFYRADCTIFNYDIIYLLTSNGPYLYEVSMGGYIPPENGGQIQQIDFHHFVSTLKELKPKAIIFPEAYVNGYYPHLTEFVLDLNKIGYDNSNIYVYIQKEQNFYYKEIHDTPDWFYQQEEIPNIIYHTIGHNVEKDDENFERFKTFKFCKQGFLCETFSKLYNLKDTCFDKEWDKRRKPANFNPYKLIFYGNEHTSIRPKVFDSINKTNDVSYQNVYYGDESLTDLVLNNGGLGLSIDGLVYNTIRDVEFGINVTPSIKVTRANEYICEHNNISMFDTRKICRVPADFFTVNMDDHIITKKIRESIDEYMAGDYMNYEKAKKQSKYHFFLTLLQKFYNVEFFLYDIMFNEYMEDFLDKLNLEVNYKIFEVVANEQNLANYTKELLYNDYVKELYSIFENHFKALYFTWYNS